MNDSQLTNMARALGRRGGQATARRLRPEQRRASARRAIEARWYEQERALLSRMVAILRAGPVHEER